MSSHTPRGPAATARSPGFENRLNDPDKDHHAPYYQYEQPRGVYGCVVKVHLVLDARGRALGLRGGLPLLFKLFLKEVIERGTDNHDGAKQLDLFPGGGNRRAQYVGSELKLESQRQVPTQEQAYLGVRVLPYPQQRERVPERGCQGPEPDYRRSYSLDHQPQVAYRYNQQLFHDSPSLTEPLPADQPVCRIVCYSVGNRKYRLR